MKINKKYIIFSLSLFIFIIIISVINGFTIKNKSINNHIFEKFDDSQTNTTSSIDCSTTNEDDGIHVSMPCYNIVEIEDFLSSDDCDRIIQLASNRLEPSRVYTDNSDLHDTSNRKSDQAWLLNDMDPLVQRISQQVADHSGYPIENQEDLQVVHYEPGGFFKSHYDACEGTKEFCQRMDGVSGPRILTYIVYLNDDIEGGETYFPYLNRKVVPKKGKLVVFQSSDENGKLIRQSLHGGEPVTKGVKWICNKWIRINKYVR